MPKATSYTKHRFNPTISKALRQLRVNDDIHGPMECLEDVVVVLLCILLGEYGGGLGKFLAVLLIGNRHRGIADILHQASHFALAKTRWWNNFLGTVAGWSVGQSFSGYRKSHASAHHTQLGTDTDPDFVFLKAEGLYDTSCDDQQLKERVIHYVLTICSPTTVLKYGRYLLECRIWQPDEKVPEKVVRLAAYVGVISLCYHYGLLGKFLLYWVLPLATTANMWGSFIELFKHYPYMTQTVDIVMTRNRNFGPVSRFLFGIHWENYHLVHHVDASIPSWLYETAHNIMLQDPLYAKWNEKQGWPAMLLDLIDVSLLHKDCYKELSEACQCDQDAERVDDNGASASDPNQS